MEFVTLQVSMDIIDRLPKVLEYIALRDRSLEDQARRAAQGVGLQLAEGARRQGKDRLYRWRIAAGSAAELEVALKIAIAWGYLDARRMGPLMQTVNRLVRLTWGLMRPKSGSAAWREPDREP